MNLECPHCRVVLRASDNDAGKVMYCSRCGGAFQVPAVSGQEPIIPAHGQPDHLADSTSTQSPWWVQDSPENASSRHCTGHFLGIDFGTTNSSMAWFNSKTGQAEVLLNAEGEDRTPSVVFFGAKEVLVGKYAEERLEDPADRSRIIAAAKRDLAKSRVWLIDGRRVTPVVVAAQILKKLKRDAEETHFHAPVERAVITFPAVFDEIEKDRLREAARQAGFQEIELLEEPVAAAIAYARAGIQVGDQVLVYDLGGGTFDIALLVRDNSNQSFRLAVKPRGDRIGGEDFDRALYDHLEDKLREKVGKPMCPNGYDLHLLRQCRRYKENLSATEQPSPLSWWWPGQGQLRIKLNRAKFEGLIDARVSRTVRLTETLCADASNAGYVMNSVILIGGSSRIPLVQRRLHETLRIKPQRWQKQDVAVALGAANHAEHLWGRRPRCDKAASLPPPLPENAFQAKYREAVEIVWRKRPFGRDDLERLVLLASQVGLKKGQAAEIEHRIMGDFKEVIFDRQQRASEDEPVGIAQLAEDDPIEIAEFESARDTWLPTPPPVLPNPGSNSAPPSDAVHPGVLLLILLLIEAVLLLIFPALPLIAFVPLFLCWKRNNTRWQAQHHSQ
jgi:hypothetical protein